MDRIIEARLDALGKRIKVSPPDERGRVGIIIDASIPACSENEAQLMWGEWEVPSKSPSQPPDTPTQ
jgi:hypothetical protein